MTKPKSGGMKLRRVTLTWEVLMPAEDDIGNLDISNIVQECTSGSWSGRSSVPPKKETIRGRKACQIACNAQGSDLGFFFPEEL
jgi:hypothetical protein